MIEASLSPPRAVIFDFDGVLADSEAVHYRSFATALAELGIEISRERDSTRFIGVRDREAFATVLAEEGRDADAPGLLDRLVERKSRLLRASIDEIPLYPGARDALREASRRVPTTIASASLRRDVLTVLERHGLARLLPEVVTGNEIRRSKPDPDAFLQALELLREHGRADLEPGDCLVFEDSLHGLEAARRAGMRRVAVATSFPPATLAPRAELVLPSIAEWSWPEAAGTGSS